MNKKKYKVLVLEKEPVIACFICDKLKISDKYELASVSKVTEAYKISSSVDVILVDEDHSDDKTLLKRIAKLSEKTSVILVTKKATKGKALEAIHRGADHFLLKKNFGTVEFEHAIGLALERRLLQHKLRTISMEVHRKEAAFLGLLSKNADGMVVIDNKKHILFANPAAFELLYGTDIIVPQSIKFEYPYSIHKRTEVTLENGVIVELVATAVEWKGCKSVLITMRDVSRYKKEVLGLQSALANMKYALASEKVLLDELNRRNRDLIELSIKDGLTKLYNHRFIQERIDFEFKRARRYKTKLSCMIFDIDHFKQVNDTYGHQFGDLVLRELSAIVQQNTREVDISGRYGGEEFMIITTQDINGAMMHATKLHKAIESHVFEDDVNSIRVTVSIGIAEFSPELKDKHELIERADAALYKAKEDGRNLIRIWKKIRHDSKPIIDEKGINSLKKKVVDLSQKVRSTYIESTYALLKAIDAKDHYTLKHSENVSSCSVKIAEAMGVPKEEVEVIKNAALLHDIGKIGVEERILTKVASLTKSEFESLKMHSVIGVNILKDVKFLEKEVPIILHHHEHYDGSGYPQGLKGREIPLGSLILSVADSYDAMTTDRKFQPKMDKESAAQEIRNGIGTHYCPEVADAFLKLYKDNKI